MLGPLKQMDGIAPNGPDITYVGLFKTWKWLEFVSKMFEKYFQMPDFIDRRLHVDSYDLNTMLFNFENDIFITFEMPRSSYILLFRPFASEVLGICKTCMWI